MPVVRRELKGGRGHLLVAAIDAAQGQVRKVVGVAEKKGVPCCTLGDKSRLGRSVGRSPVSAVLVTEKGFAEQLLRTLGLPPMDGDMSSPAALEAHGRRLRELHREDFREARVVELGGWTLSLTELRLAALVWLDGQPKRRS